MLDHDVVACSTPSCPATAPLDRSDAPCPRGWLRLDCLLETSERHHSPDQGYHVTRIAGTYCSASCAAARLVAMTRGWGIPINQHTPVAAA